MVVASNTTLRAMAMHVLRGLANRFSASVRRFVVVDESMRPGLVPGQGIIAIRWPRRRRGQRRIVAHPYEPMLIVKRLQRREPDGRWWVTADNPVGTDSSHFGPVDLTTSWLVLVTIPVRWMR